MCLVKIDSKEVPIECSYTSSSTELIFRLSITEKNLAPASSVLTITHYGVTTTTSGSALNVNVDIVTVYPTANPDNVLQRTTNIPLAFQAAVTEEYLGASKLSLSNL